MDSHQSDYTAMSYDHTELFALVRVLLEANDEEYLRQCIQQCHNGKLRGPIDQSNLHLFRRYRNDPVHGSGEAQVLIDRATANGVERAVTGIDEDARNKLVRGLSPKMNNDQRAFLDAVEASCEGLSDFVLEDEQSFQSLHCNSCNSRSDDFRTFWTMSAIGMGDDNNGEPEQATSILEVCSDCMLFHTEGVFPRQWSTFSLGEANDD